MTKVNTGEKIHKPKKGKGSYDRQDIEAKNNLVTLINFAKYQVQIKKYGVKQKEV